MDTSAYFIVSLDRHYLKKRIGTGSLTFTMFSSNNYASVKAIHDKIVSGVLKDDVEIYEEIHAKHGCSSLAGLLELNGRQ